MCQNITNLRDCDVCAYKLSDWQGKAEADPSLTSHERILIGGSQAAAEANKNRWTSHHILYIKFKAHMISMGGAICYSSIETY